ncbi:MAG: glycosyltransferase [Bacilli bacterium]|nr:glycosyltransferase [Bacilli bacterium]
MHNKISRVLQVGMSTNYGGTESIIYEIYRNIDRTKIQFDFLNVYDEPIAKQEWLESMGARILPLKLKRREGYLKYLRGIKTFYEEHAHEFDVVVCNVQCLDQIAMAKYAKKYGVPKTIIHLHNANYGIQPSKLARAAIAWNKRHCHKYVDQFLACSTLAAKWGFRSKDCKKTTIIKNGVPIEAMRFELNKRSAFRREFGFGTENRVYGSAGRLDPQKNQLFLLNVFREIALRDDGARFVLLGRGPLETKIKETIKEIGLGSKCVLISKIDDIGRFYSGIDCFLFPSKFEGLGMVLIEAQCSGLPCLATKGTIPPEVKLRDDFRFLSLDLGPTEWAEEAMKSFEDNQRNIAYKCVIDAGRDVAETAIDYCELVLSCKTQG